MSVDPDRDELIVLDVPVRELADVEVRLLRLASERGLEVVARGVVAGPTPGPLETLAAGMSPGPLAAAERSGGTSTGGTSTDGTSTGRPAGGRRRTAPPGQPEIAFVEPPNAWAPEQGRRDHAGTVAGPLFGAVPAAASAEATVAGLLRDLEPDHVAYVAVLRDRWRSALRDALAPTGARVVLAGTSVGSVPPDLGAFG